MILAIYNYAKLIWALLNSKLWPEVQSQHDDIEALKKALGDLPTKLENLSLKMDETIMRLKQLQAAELPQTAVAFRAYLLDEQGNRLVEINQGEVMNAKVSDAGFSIELVAVDKFGNEGAALDGPLAWTNDGTFTNVDTSADPSGLKAKVTFVGAVGDTVVTAKGDGDLGPGVTEILFSQDFHLLPGDAVSFKANVTPIA